MNKVQYKGAVYVESAKARRCRDCGSVLHKDNTGTLCKHCKGEAGAGGAAPPKKNKVQSK